MRGCASASTAPPNTRRPHAARSPGSTTFTKAAIPARHGSWFIDIFAIACLVFSVTGFPILNVSATLFLSGPDEYDGGELTVMETY